MSNTKAKRAKRLARQIELLKNFEGDFYQEKKIGNEWYVKSWNGGTKRWQVSIYSEISYNAYKSFSEMRKDDIKYEKEHPNQSVEVDFQRPTLESIKEKLLN